MQGWHSETAMKHLWWKQHEQRDVLNTKKYPVEKLLLDVVLLN